MATAIKIENISKRYRLGEVGTGTLAHDLHRMWAKLRGKPDPFAKVGDVNKREQVGGEYAWALKDVSFEVEQGEILGIIGSNGAGKSTLLKLLSRVTAPTTGKIKTKGRIASLLEVGTGFHPELTGRENIYLNGAIMGMTRGEISRRIDEIIDFSGCEKYIDTPVKRYSSGMTVRLGFAVAAHLDCEILVVDEVLAVGDVQFQRKCIGKMQNIGHSGKTVIVVSHNMASIQNLCRDCFVLEHGTPKYFGPSQDAISFYMDKQSEDKNSEYFLTDCGLDTYISKLSIGSLTDFQPIYSGESVRIAATIVNLGEATRVLVGFGIFHESGIRIASYNGEDSANFYIELKANSETEVTCNIEGLNLLPGSYPVNAAITHSEQRKLVHFLESRVELEISETDVFGTGRLPRDSSIIYTQSSWHSSSNQMESY